MEHPFYGSWGYQTTGYFAPTSRYGTPQDLMYLIDTLHQRGIGVILDWVPSHFPTDEHGLAYFDGTHLYEHADRRQGHHPDWDSFIFNYGRHEVRSFLLSSALFWLEDLPCRRPARRRRRLDAPPRLFAQAGRVGARTPTAAPRTSRRSPSCAASTRTCTASSPTSRRSPRSPRAWPLVSRPLYLGGLGFGLKWDMGWMHDTPRLHGQGPGPPQVPPRELTFRQDVRLLGELRAAPLARRGGARQGVAARQDAGRRLAEVRQPAPAVRATCMLSPARSCSSWETSSASGRNGTTTRAWTGTCWPATGTPACSAGCGTSTSLYREEAALHELDCDPAGFQWIDCNDADESVLVMLRKGRSDAGSGADRVQLHAPGRGRATGSGCRVAGAGTSGSTATPRATGEPAGATTARSRRLRTPPAAAGIRCC